MTPAEAVRGFLDALGVPAARIPVSLDAQAALYRSLLAGRRMLVVLDNARDAEQVRPLLPGSPRLLVVVTSRNRLTGLVAAEGAQPADRWTCSPRPRRASCWPAAWAQTGWRASRRRSSEIIALCARLPLALSIVAARAAAHPAFPLAALAERAARRARRRLDALDAGDAATSVRAVFSWSYRSGSATRRRGCSGCSACTPGPTSPRPPPPAWPPSRSRRRGGLLAELTGAHLHRRAHPGPVRLPRPAPRLRHSQTHAHDPDTDRTRR